MANPTDTTNPLTVAEFDAAAWLAEVEALGGSVYWSEDGIQLQYPIDENTQNVMPDFNVLLQEKRAKDPDNRLLWKYERRRLEAEVIRDGILYLSGGLNPAMGGPSIFPPLPDDLADFARYGRTGGLMWEPNETEEDARRRSIYIFQRRSLALPMMAAFDANAFSESCERRSSTTPPLQALSMLNGYLAVTFQ